MSERGRLPADCNSVIAIMTLLVVLVTGSCGGGRTGPAGAVGAVADFPGLAAIREADLRDDIFTLAGDGFRGREAATLDELRASMWLAERARAAGLEPAGESGTYFQFWSLTRSRLDRTSRIAADGSPLSIGEDIVLISPAEEFRHQGPVVFVGEGRAADLAGKELAGRVVAAVVTPSARSADGSNSLRHVRYAFSAVTTTAATLRQHRPAAILLIADPIADSGFDWIAGYLTRGQFGIDSAGGPAAASAQTVPLFFARAALRDRMARTTRMEVALARERTSYPSVNVVAKVRGTDPARRDEFVLFSAHQDHDGVRAPVAGDSIYNGADDNATVSVALLAIGRAFAAQPAPRSALFVWHGAEERGLLGSRWHASHPMVPLARVVAVLNGDMIGSNHPDTAALLGSQPPHRNSTALVELGLRANALASGFVIDSSWDRPDHPEGWYFRSDHLPYARAGVPSLYFSTLPHARYHTPDDEPEFIDLRKLTRMTKWMYATGWLVATAAARPPLDPAVTLER
jgi:hypothetical protein